MSAVYDRYLTSGKVLAFFAGFTTGAGLSEKPKMSDILKASPGSDLFVGSEAESGVDDEEEERGRNEDDEVLKADSLVLFEELEGREALDIKEEVEVGREAGVGLDFFGGLASVLEGSGTIVVESG